MTGPSPAVRQAVYERDGYSCVRCNDRSGPFAIQHRRARKAGGSKAPDKNYLSNLILVCDLVCHRWMETQERAEAERLGYVVSEYAESATTPLMWHGSWSLLTDMGAVEPAERAS